MWPDRAILKVLANKFSLKNSLNIWRLCGLFGKKHFLIKNCCGYFFGNFMKILATFYYNIWSHWSTATICSHYTHVGREGRVSGGRRVVAVSQNGDDVISKFKNWIICHLSFLRQNGIDEKQYLLFFVEIFFQFFVFVCFESRLYTTPRPKKRASRWYAVWPVKSHQMSVKVAQNVFTRKMKDFDTFRNCLRMWDIWVN